MNRTQKENKVLRQDGKVFEIRNLLIKESYRSEEYVLSKSEVATITATGHLAIFELRPIVRNGPSFVGRWDGGSRSAGNQERDDLDIDIRDVSKRIVGQFERGKDGYSGHHSTQVQAGTGRAYKVCIRTPDKLIFDGIISFTVHRKMELLARSRVVAASIGVQKRSISGQE